MATQPRASDLLERPPWRSDGSGAHYSPYSQYLQVGRDDLAPWLTKPKEAETPEVSELQSILHHELAHWIQSHGTSSGALLSAWRGRQWDCFLEIPAQLGVEVIAGMLRRRLTGAKRPFVGVGATGLVRDAMSRAAPSFRTWRSRWWALQVAQGTLENPSGVLAVRDNVATLWRQSLLTATGTPAEAATQGRKAPPQQDLALRETLRSHVTTKDLIEGFASVNQLIYYLLAKQVDDGPWLQKNIDTTVASLSETTYGKALRRYLAIYPAAREDIYRNLVHFCLVVDLALNPCLADARDRCLGGAGVDEVFRETYPPARFERLCAILGDEPIVPFNGDSEQVRLCQQHLLARSGLKVAETVQLRAPLAEPPHALTYQSDVLMRHALADVEAFWQQRAFDVRRQHPALFVLPPAQYLQGRTWVRELLRNEQSRPVLLPPMMTDSRRHVYFGLPHGASHCLLFWSVAANAAHSLLTGKGLLELAHFPDEVLGSGIAEDAVGCVLRHLGVRSDAMRFVDRRSGIPDAAAGVAETGGVSPTPA